MLGFPTGIYPVGSEGRIPYIWWISGGQGQALPDESGRPCSFHTVDLLYLSYPWVWLVYYLIGIFHGGVGLPSLWIACGGCCLAQMARAPLHGASVTELVRALGREAFWGTLLMSRVARACPRQCVAPRATEAGAVTVSRSSLLLRPPQGVERESPPECRDPWGVEDKSVVDPALKANGV